MKAKTIYLPHIATCDQCKKEKITTYTYNPKHKHMAWVCGACQRSGRLHYKYQGSRKTLHGLAFPREGWRGSTC